MHTHLVLNRNARHLRGETAVRTALREAARDRCILHETFSLAELDQVALRIVAARPSSVILAGGDGAYMAGLTALHRASRGAPLPRVALAPGGTVSTVARNLGLRGDRVRYAERIVRAVSDGSAREAEQPTLLVREDRGDERVGFIFGTGLVVKFFDLYASAGSGGYAAAARIVGRVFASSFIGGSTASRVLSPLPATLTVDGARETPRAYSLVVASVVKNLGLGMRVTYRAGDDPSRVHLVASPLGARALGPQLPLVLAGTRLRGSHHVDRLVARFRVDFTGTRRAYVLDGDPFESDGVEVSPGPRVRTLTLP